MACPRPASISESGPVGAVLVWAAMAIGNGGVSEEPGWRGFVQPKLETNRPPPAPPSSGPSARLWHPGEGFEAGL